MSSDGDAAALRVRVADAILDAEADAIVACDRDGMICFWSPGAARIFGFAADEALGRSLDIIIPERLQARHWEGFHQMMDSGRSRYPEGHLLAAPGRRKDGSQVSIEFTVVTLKDEAARVAHIVAIMRDVSERFEEMKALRKQLRDSAPA
jgi:PAS domain S-box-containing protein